MYCSMVSSCTCTYSRHCLNNHTLSQLITSSYIDCLIAQIRLNRQVSITAWNSANVLSIHTDSAAGITWRRAPVDCAHAETCIRYFWFWKRILEEVKYNL